MGRREPISVRVRIDDNPVDIKTEFYPLMDRVDHHDIVRVAQEAVSRSGLRTPRANPVAVKVKVFTQQLVRGEIKETPHQVEVVPPLERMTDTEYKEEMDELLEKLPPEFHAFVRGQACEHGHDAGYEEIVSIAQGLVHDLSPCIKAYNKAKGIT